MPSVLFLVFCAFNYAAAKTVIFVVKNGVLSLRYRTLLFGKLNMDVAIAKRRHQHLLLGLSITEFCHAFERARSFGGNPVEAADFTALGIEGLFIAVGYV